MSLPVVYRRAVARDLAAGFQYYQEQVDGLGEAFFAAVNTSLDAIEQYPQMFAQVHGEVRRAVVARFPYAVFYRVESKRVIVLTLLHTSRDPKVWPQPRKPAR